jgi:hypothetical protein
VKKYTMPILLPLLLLLFASISSVSANPIWITDVGFGDWYPWINFKITPSGIHIASDPLFESTIVNSIAPFELNGSATSLMKGWVTFVCASDNPKNIPTGFDFSITLKNAASGKYDVKAYPTVTLLPNGTLVPSSDLGFVTSYTLGTLKVGGKGEGQLKGFYDLNGPAFYAWTIVVELSGSAMFETHFADPVDFEIAS